VASESGHTRAIANFDLHDPSYGERTTEAEAELRARCPVAWSEQYDGYWTISGWEALADGLRDRKRFSAEKWLDEDGVTQGGTIIPPLGAGWRALPNESDPPDWTFYRKAISSHFAPAAVQKLRPKVHMYATEVIDHIIEVGECDFITQVASPTTALITLDMLGLPLADWRFYAEAIHSMFTGDPGPNSGDSLREIVDRLDETIADRHANPVTDPDRTRLIDELLTKDVDGQFPDDDEARDLVFNLLIGGFDTTAGLLAGSLRYLEDKPEIKQRLIDDDAYLRTATEEFLRWVSPVVGLAKTATVDFELASQSIHKGDRLWFMFRSANWDPAEFPAPEVVDLERSPNRHFAFGAGIHRCVGSNLARLVFQTVLRDFLIRVPDYKIDHDRTSAYRFAANSAGFVVMPMTFTPGKPLASRRILEKL
jgi:cytochrome P450